MTQQQPQPDPKPQCPLCASEMVVEESVQVQNASASWTMAWVCTNCSALYPMASASGGFLKRRVPLYTSGKRAEE